MQWADFESRGASWRQSDAPNSLMPNDDETWIVNIDCDYFDNTLGGNTSIVADVRSKRSDHAYAERLALVFDWLASLRRQPDVVTIALSADFCPLEISVEAMQGLMAAFAG